MSSPSIFDRKTSLALSLVTPPPPHLLLLFLSPSLFRFLSRWMMGSGPPIHVAVEEAGGSISKTLSNYSDAWLKHVPLLVISNKFKRLARKQVFSVDHFPNQEE